MPSVLKRSRRLRVSLVAVAGLALSSGLASAAERVDPHGIAAGKTLAVVGKGDLAACETCHNGKADVPRLAGLDATYHVAQLDAFAHGARQDAEMAKIAKAMDAPAKANVAAYYGSLAPAVQSTQSPAAPVPILEAGAQLAQRGEWAIGIPPCAACHGRNGHGVGVAFPAIAGQPASYIAGQLRAWKSGARRDERGLMRTVANRLSDAHIAAVSAYYATLPPAAGVAR